MENLDVEMCEEEGGGSVEPEGGWAVEVGERERAQSGPARAEEEVRGVRVSVPWPTAGFVADIERLVIIMSVRNWRKMDWGWDND